MKVEQLPPILVYYRFRGQLQPIRNLYCYLKQPFIEIDCEWFEREKEKMPPLILQEINKFKVDKNKLPALIHNDLLVYGQESIATYTCKKFNHEELFGSNIQIRAKVQQIMSTFFLNQPESMRKLLVLIEEASGIISDQQLNHRIKDAFQVTMDNSKYMKQGCQYLDKQENPNYVFKQITLFDFFFLETCFYIIGVHGDQKRVYLNALKEWDLMHKERSTSLNKPNAYYIRVMKKYLEFMMNEPFYRENKDYLESFSIVSPFIKPEMTSGLKRIWIGNPKAVS